MRFGYKTHKRYNVEIAFSSIGVLVAAIMGVSPENVPDDYTYTEEHWTDVNS